MRLKKIDFELKTNYLSRLNIRLKKGQKSLLNEKNKIIINKVFKNNDFERDYSFFVPVAPIILNKRKLPKIHYSPSIKYSVKSPSESFSYEESKSKPIPYINASCKNFPIRNIKIIKNDKKLIENFNYYTNKIIYSNSLISKNISPQAEVIYLPKNVNKKNNNLEIYNKFNNQSDINMIIGNKIKNENDIYQSKYYYNDDKYNNKNNNNNKNNTIFKNNSKINYNNSLKQKIAKNILKENKINYNNSNIGYKYKSTKSQCDKIN